MTARRGGTRSWLIAFALLSWPAVAGANFGANILFYQSRFSELETYMEREIGDPSKAAAADLLYLCSAYSQLKKYNKLFPCLDHWERRAAGGDTGGWTVGGDVTWYLHVQRADASIELGDYGKAIEHGQAAYQYVVRNKRREQEKIFPLSSLSLAYALAGDRAAAEQHAKLLAEADDVLGANLSNRLFGLAKVHLALGNYRECVQTIENEGKMRSPLGALTHAIGVGMGALAFTEIPKYFIHAKCLLEAGQQAEAKKGYEALLAYPQISSMGSLYWIALFDRGRIAEAEGNPTEAIGFYRRAIDLIEEQRSSINTEASKIGFAGDKQAVYQAMVGALFAATRHAEALEFVERSKARALVDMLADKKDFSITAPNESEIRALLDNDRTAGLDALAYIPPEPGQPAKRNLALQAIRHRLEQHAPELASLMSVRAAPVAEIQRLLPVEEVLLEYYYDDKALYVFALARDSLSAHKLDVSNLETDVRALREAIEEPATTVYEPPAQRLHARLLAPLGEIVRGKKLLIVAHGALHYLPFAVLHDGTSFLIERHSLRFLPSASVLRYLRPSSRGERGGVLAFGNPDLDDPRLDLKFAQEEALEIVKKTPRSRALLRKEASESAFRKFAAGFSALHFATHGEFRSDAPLSSALMLAKDADSDGLLTVSKLYSTRLAADLVTLSACETGLGKVASGDDVVGLTRGFLYAGASTVVASLWKVDDQATSALMTRFYDELKAGDKREALRKAQLATREQFPHPFFWAAFQLTGRAD